MNVYIWDYVSPLSLAYHDGGAVLVVADSVSGARDLWLHSDEAQEIRAHGGNPDTTLAGGPDHVIPTVETEEARVMFFLDTGCC